MFIWHSMYQYSMHHQFLIKQTPSSFKGKKKHDWEGRSVAFGKFEIANSALIKEFLAMISYKSHEQQLR